MIFHIFNQDDIPQFGCGYRAVIALTPKRKWITLVDWTTCDVAKVEIAKWRAMNPQPAKYRKGLVRKHMLARMTYLEGKSKALKAALRSLKTTKERNLP